MEAYHLGSTRTFFSNHRKLMRTTKHGILGIRKKSSKKNRLEQRNASLDRKVNTCLDSLGTGLRAYSILVYLYRELSEKSDNAGTRGHGRGVHMLLCSCQEPPLLGAQYLPKTLLKLAVIWSPRGRSQYFHLLCKYGSKKRAFKLTYRGGRARPGQLRLSGEKPTPGLERLVLTHSEPGSYETSQFYGFGPKFHVLCINWYGLKYTKNCAFK
ncbi:unnamed protein product [Nesidiocoris tenuis]|uniref:Uncharacterized protein n=1 Tax=Nesidiocoris tenuis TaxID=355587 RepID=A0A6H5FV43_9HEMI|nr:unnamed protein product [Nesidiocoris tenuis]